MAIRTSSGGWVSSGGDCREGIAPRAVFDAELSDLPQSLRWREWMGRIEAAIFASDRPVPREALAPLVGAACVLDDLIADIRDELKARPYDIVFVAGGWRHRTRSRFAQAILAAHGERETVVAPDLNQTETLVLAAIAYRQPITRAALSDHLTRDVARDTLARLKRIGLIGAGPRLAEPGAPLTYVTTQAFLETFGLASLRDLPDPGDAIAGTWSNQPPARNNASTPPIRIAVSPLQPRPEDNDDMLPEFEDEPFATGE